jgi:MFS family permease
MSAQSGTLDTPARSGAVALTNAQQAQAFLFGGLLLALMNFSSPAAGIIDIPVTFFLKNRMHLASHELAVFKLWVGAPLFVAFVLGFIRDRWSPFGGGDRAHLLVFAGTTAVFYGIMALIIPTYWVFLVGLFVATITFRMVSSAAYGVTNTLAQRHAVSGRMSSVISMASSFPDLISFVGGGLLSQTLEGEGAAAAARTLFLCAAGIMLAIAVLGLTGPKWVFDEARQEPHATHVLADLKRLVRHWPIYPAMTIQLLWQFSPATGTVLQYHIVDKLHASDAQWGAWQGIFFGSFLPIYAGYAYLSRRFRLSTLLWGGFAVAVFQMVPLLLVHDAVGALFAAVPMGLLGAVAQAALVDLVIRSSPRGLQGTTMMLFYAIYYVSVRFGDLFGTWIYDRHGGFIPTVVITIIVYAAILPIILLVPRELTSTRDAAPLEA